MGGSENLDDDGSPGTDSADKKYLKYTEAHAKGERGFQVRG
jgi:hypothetical protein